jgi:hypothetical protein
MAGKTGADAVFVFVKRICNTLTRYRTKLEAFIDVAETASIITADQATLARTFVSTADAACTVFQLLAQYNSVNP